MKVRDIVLVLITAILLIWFLASWFEVLACSGTGIEHEYCQANMFFLIGEMGR